METGARFAKALAISSTAAAPKLWVYIHISSTQAYNLTVLVEAQIRSIKTEVGNIVISRT